MLSQERSAREEWESVQEEREGKVRAAERRVRDLEDERQRLDDELKKHVERTRRVNIGQEVLSAKMKVKEQECEIEREAASRVTILNPAASLYIRSRSQLNEDGQTGSDKSSNTKILKIQKIQKYICKCNLHAGTGRCDRRACGRPPTVAASGGGTGPGATPSVSGAASPWRR
jgi:hypothetical protein